MNKFDPNSSRCVDWRKIDKNYGLDFVGGDLDKCGVCSAPSTAKCAGCFRVSYCSPAHQKSDWAKGGHKRRCSPFKIDRNDEVGRFVVAARDIRAGEVVIEEPPITVGPKQFTPPICLGCYTGLSRDDNRPCSGCSWPLCSEECEKAPIHLIECRYLSECKFKPKFECDAEGKPWPSHPIYECITALRCTLVRNLVPDNWRVLNLMEQHTETRKDDEFYGVNQTNTVNFIRKFVLGEDEVTAGEINAAIDVLDVNAFEIRGRGFSIRGVYPLTAMMNSVCSPNTQNCIDSDFVCRVRAARDIAKGEEVTTSYTLTLANTAYRRRHLKESKYFDCKCSRCADPTELGSRFSAQKCGECRKGFMEPSDSLDERSDWKCDNCTHRIDFESAGEIAAKLEAQVEELPFEKVAYEKQLKYLEEHLHPNHSIATDVKFSLVQLYGRARLADEAAMIREGKRKRQLCNEVLDLMAEITPGKFRLRGMFLCELYVVSMYLLRQEASSGRKKMSAISPDKLKQLRPLLTESIEILSWEPPDSVEGERCHLARDYLATLDINIKKAQK